MMMNGAGPPAVVDRMNWHNFMTQAEADERLEACRNQMLEAQRRLFPLSDNLFALVTTVLSDLNEMQRERFASTMALRGLRIQQYSYDIVREIFIELFCAPRSSLDNPNLRSSQTSRSFCILDEGEMDEMAGYWVEDDDTGELGFLPEWEDVFWTHDDLSFTWASAHFSGRKLRRGAPRFGGKGRGKGGYKGRFKRKYRSRGKGNAHFADEEWSNWTKGKGKKGKGKYKGKGDGKGFSKGGKHQGKSKGKGDFKGDKGKGSPDQTHLVDAAPPSSASTPEIRSSGDVWYDDSWYQDTWWTDDYQDWSSGYEAEEWHTSPGWTATTVTTQPPPPPSTNDYAGFFVECLDEQSDQVLLVNSGTGPGSDAESNPENIPISYTLLNSQRRDDMIDCVNIPMLNLKMHPTYVILDLGCTRAMGSRTAATRLASALSEDFYIQYLPSNSLFRFANSDQTTCTEKMRVWFPKPEYSTEPHMWTDFDIIEQGDVPMLMSLVQMRNLRFQLHLTPEAAWLYTPAKRGLHHCQHGPELDYAWIRLMCSTSKHLILNLEDLGCMPLNISRIVAAHDADQSHPSFAASSSSGPSNVPHPNRPVEVPPRKTVFQEAAHADQNAEVAEM